MTSPKKLWDTHTMLPQFRADTADAIWRQAADTLLHGNSVHQQDSRLGYTRELLHCTFHLTNPRQRWVFSRTPALNPAFAIAEVVWILQGRDDAAFLQFWNPALPRFVGRSEKLNGAYGQRLLKNLKFDQLEGAWRALSNNPDSRQVVLQIWDGNRDFPNSDGSARDPDIPCNVCAMPKVREGCLEWLQVMRSNDLFLGTPHNFVQFTVLQEVLAGWLGLELGHYVQISDSLHLYESDLRTMSVTLAPLTEQSVESLALPKSEFDEMIIALGASMDALRDPALTREGLREMIERPALPNAWANMLRIAAADSARRRGWIDEIAAASSACTNGALTAMWIAWENRMSKTGSRLSEMKAVTP